MLAIGLVSCTLKDNVSRNKIIAKYKVLDEVMSVKHFHCREEVKSFKEMDRYDCSFKLDNDEFDIMEKYTYDDNGNVKEYWNYYPEGPLIYTMEDFLNDPKLMKSMNIDGLSVSLLDSNKVIDAKDTLIIERIRDNLIFVVRNQEMVDKHIKYLYELHKN